MVEGDRPGIPTEAGDVKDDRRSCPIGGVGGATLAKSGFPGGVIAFLAKLLNAAAKEAPPPLAGEPG